MSDPSALESKNQEISINENIDSNNNNDYLSIIIKVTISIVIIVLIILAIIQRSIVNEQFNETIDFINKNPLQGMIVVMLLQIVATLIWIPGSILTIGSGFAYQQAMKNPWLATLLGSASVFTGATIGSILAFILGRYLFRGMAQSLSKSVKFFNALDRAMEKEGFKFTILLRLCPLIPFNAMNQMMGISNVSLLDYSLGSIGMIPGTTVYVFLGTTISSVTEIATAGSFSDWYISVLWIVGTIAALGVIIYISKVVTNILNEELAEEENIISNSELNKTENEINK